jgi:hypothetical protein
MADASDLSAKVILMVGLAIDELAMLEGEPDLAKTSAGISAVRATLRELLDLAGKTAEKPPSK